MADALPPIRYARLVRLVELLKSGRIKVKIASQWAQKHSLLLLAFVASTVYRTWLTTPLNGLLRWVGGIYYYYQAYWLVNIYTFKDVQKCSSILQNVKGWEPGYDFWGMRNDQWWLYMSCLGNDAGWSKRLWDNVVSSPNTDLPVDTNSQRTRFTNQSIDCLIFSCRIGVRTNGS